MKKKCKVVMLPTENESNIWSHKGRRLYFNQANFNDINDEIRYHLYITSDDRIKEGDWYMFMEDSVLFGQFKQAKRVESQLPFQNCNKIIATTDTSLTIHDDNLGENWIGNLPQLSQELIQAYCNKPFDEIEVEYEILNPYSSCNKVVRLKTDSSNNIITSFSKDSYSREEVISLLKLYQEDFCNFESIKPGLEILKSTINLPQYWKDWIKQNL